MLDMHLNQHILAEWGIQLSIDCWFTERRRNDCVLKMGNLSRVI